MSEAGLLLFDLDGTLIDSSEDIANSINATRQMMRLAELPVETVRSHLGDGARELVRRCFPEKSEDEIDDVLKAFRMHYGEHCTVRTRPYPGVSEILPELKEQYKMAVVTNKHRSVSVDILKRLGLLQHFEMVVGGDGPCLKPCPEGILQILDQLQIETQNAIIIGDHHTDLEAGRRAGIRRIFCSYGFGNSGDEEPDAAIERFADLPARLDKRMAGSGAA